jgi:hypothetical protein
MLARIAAGVVGAIFLLAGASKAVNITQWKIDAKAQGVRGSIAICIPVVELLLGACLVALPVSAVVLGLSTTMLLVFTAFLVAQIKTSSDVPCACFGAFLRRVPSWRDVVRNLLMIAFLFFAAAMA